MGAPPIDLVLSNWTLVSSPHRFWGASAAAQRERGADRAGHRVSHSVDDAHGIFPRVSAGH